MSTSSTIALRDAAGGLHGSPVWSQAQKLVDEQIVVTVSGKLKVTFTVHWGHEPLMIYVKQLAATTKKLE
jgi:hypothetical protein